MVIHHIRFYFLFSHLFQSYLLKTRYIKLKSRFQLINTEAFEIVKYEIRVKDSLEELQFWHK